MVRYSQYFALTNYNLVNTVSIFIIFFQPGNPSLCFLWELHEHVFLNFYRFFMSIIWIVIKEKWMGKLFQYKILIVFGFNRSYFFSKWWWCVYQYTIVRKYLKCVKISWLLSNITITSSVIYTHKYLHTIKVMVVE